MNCVVVGGAGAVGGMFVDLLKGSGIEVRVLDLVSGADITDIDATQAEELAGADTVLLAVPERVALAAIKPLTGILRPGALLVDTVSVKGAVVETIRAHAAGIEAISLNPMFAPSLGILGRPVAAVVVHDGPRVRELVRLLDTWGARVVLVDAAEHDRLAAAAQALTHAAVLGFGLALTELGVGVTELSAIAPPPHLTMLALLARIAGGAPEVYWDVQSANRQAPAARAALVAGVRRVAEVIERGDEATFASLLGTLNDFLGMDFARYRELCAEIFEGMEEK